MNQPHVPATRSGRHLVGLVGCSWSKLQRPAPARELYTSQLFRKAAAYAEWNCDRWYILSAKHGLLHPDQVIPPYDVKLGTWQEMSKIIWMTGTMLGQPKTCSRSRRMSQHCSP